MGKKNTASGTTAKRSTSSTPRVPQQVPGVPEHADGASNADEDSSLTRSQVAQVTAALNVLSSGGESQYNVHRQDG
eukprot:CAMPEP_0172581868 /NCGR_PEP_ID=MMETSP1068-20121228/1233_1 /TAXON_ID=35684 /ORGANISM="Pseudopedinella elastica, Strain CCMP716" /LENGTH=75 /DNA_ID=CAMNT_0013374997 /DNA_START=262 /DNA_END=489 /DNA_ORIENTATION=+